MSEELQVEKIIEKMSLKNLTPEIDLADKKVTVPDINRPALQLTGFFDHFDSERVQIIGHVEAAYMETMDKLTRKEPLIVEIPDRHATAKISDTISKYLSEAVGIKL